MARHLGRLGGRKRAARLSADRKRRIAALGGQARAESFAIARRVEETLRYAATMAALQPRSVAPRARSVRTGGSLVSMSMRPNPTDQLDEVGAIVEQLRNLGLEPVLVGGMALVTLGSRRVTRDFDFVIARPEARLEALLDVFYGRGMELASRVNANGDVTATIGNRRVAAIRLRLDAPATAYFVNRETGLRIDLLFDVPVPASALLEGATRKKVRSQVFRIASAEDLLRLKKIASARRRVPADNEDIAFLEARRTI
jgi:hypothetical protein